MKDVEDAITRWAYDPKPDVRTVMPSVYRVRDFRRMLLSLDQTPKKRRKR